MRKILLFLSVCIFTAFSVPRYSFSQNIISAEVDEPSNTKGSNDPDCKICLNDYSQTIFIKIAPLNFPFEVRKVTAVGLTTMGRNIQINNPISGNVSLLDSENRTQPNQRIQAGSSYLDSDGNLTFVAYISGRYCIDPGYTNPPGSFGLGLTVIVDEFKATNGNYAGSWSDFASIFSIRQLNCDGTQPITPSSPGPSNTPGPSSNQQRTGLDGEFFSVETYPNPTSNSLILNFETKENILADAEIFNSSGQVVVDIFNQEFFSSGNYSQKISLKELPKGVYILHFKVNDKVHLQKILRQ